jgi:hypothetical protein
MHEFKDYLKGNVSFVKDANVMYELKDYLKSNVYIIYGSPKSLY